MGGWLNTKMSKDNINPEYKKLLDAKNLNTKMDALLVLEFALLRIYEGYKCEKCGCIQGKPNIKKGIRKYYCDCFYRRVERRFVKEKKMVTQELFETKFWEKKPSKSSNTEKEVGK